MHESYHVCYRLHFSFIWNAALKNHLVSLSNLNTSFNSKLWTYVSQGKHFAWLLFNVINISIWYKIVTWFYALVEVPQV